VALGSGGTMSILNVHKASGSGLLSLSSDFTTTDTQMGQINFGSTGLSGEKRTAIIYSNKRDASATSADGDLIFGTSNAGAYGDRLTIKNNGNVGIGTIAPTHALNVVGDINATGTIYRDGGTAVTDFIFDNYYDGNINLEIYPYAENYTLVPLSELNNYLKTNRHLPNFPGEKLTGQVDSAEIDRLLLEKTEEQAIYIIQLNAAFQKQQNELISQNQTLSVQEQQLQELNTRIQVLEAQQPQNPAFPAKIRANSYNIHYPPSYKYY